VQCQTGLSGLSATNKVAEKECQRIVIVHQKSTKTFFSMSKSKQVQITQMLSVIIHEESVI